MRFQKLWCCVVVLLCPLPAMAQAKKAAKKPAAKIGEKTYSLHSWTKTQLDKDFYSEGATLGDINKDGKMDLISGPYWHQGPDFKIRHEYYKPAPFDIKIYSDNFLAFVHDINGDGHNDIFIIGFPGKDGSWYQNPGPEGWNKHWTRHLVCPVVDNESPTFADLTGDGRPEVVCGNGGGYGYYAPEAPANDPAKPWKWHPISSNKIGIQRFTHGMGIGDINGDGRLDLLEKNGWWEQPASLAGDPEWALHPYKFTGGGGAQMYAYDIDGDGDADVISSLQAHGWGLSWFEQIKDAKGQITFKPHLIMGDNPNTNPQGVAFSQPHAIDLADIDGDGLKDIVTGKRYWAHQDKDPGSLEPAVVYWWRLTRDGGNVQFIPYPIDNDSGVGTQVVAGDLNGDGLPEVIVGNKKGTFIHLNARRQVSANEYTYAHWPGMATVGYSPQAAAKRMALPQGFTSRLIAGEPDVHQPITLALDHKGRIWVAENYAYPTWAPQGKDRILILEDKEGDGDFETKKVFHDKLNFVSGMEVGYGGVWVGCPPNLLFIPDKDGDDVPDGPPVALLDGWVHNDTHETLNGFQWGPDGWLYGTHGVFNQSFVGKVGAPDSQRQVVNAAVWRYHPLKHLFETFAWGTSNPWGVDFNDQGQCFISACVIPHLYHMIQGGRFQRQAGQHVNPYVFDDIKTIADHSHWSGKGIREMTLGNEEAGGGHAHAGVLCYLGDNFPPEYRNTLIMNNIRGSRVNHDLPRRAGSGFTAGHDKDFMIANDRWYRGLNLRTGPDGGVYVNDWYDKKVCHQQRPDDRTNGRIYQFVYGSPKPVKVDLGAMSDADLVQLQLHANDWHVRTARRLLAERAAEGKLDAGARAALLSILKENPDPTRQLRALWALHVTGGFTPATPATPATPGIAADALKATDEYVRAWAIQLLCEDKAPASAISTFAGMAASDPSPVVRLYLASAMQRLPLADRWEIGAALAAHGEDANDHNLPLMIWYGIEPLVAADPDRALKLASTAKLPQVSRFIARRAAMDDKLLARAIQALQTAEGAPLGWLLAGIVDALGDRPNPAMPAGWAAAYEKLSASRDGDIAAKADFIAVKFGDQRIFPNMRKVVADGSAPAPRRQQALDLLLNGRDPQLAPILIGTLGDPAIRPAVIRALARYDDPATPGAILKVYPSLKPEVKADAVSTLSSRPAYAMALLEAVERGVVPSRDLSAFTVRQIQKFNDPSLTDRINKAWGAIRETSKDKTDQMERYSKLITSAALARADLSNGRAVYNRTCLACHQLFSAGGIIGPDLTGSNRTDVNYLLENIIDPSAVIGKDYQLSTVQTKDGRLLAGIIESQTADALILKTLTERIVLAPADVAKLETLNVSMMPEGQLAAMKDQEVIDLFAYLGSAVQAPLPGEAPIKGAKPAAPAPAGPVYKAAGAIEGEDLKVISATGGKPSKQSMTRFERGRWSGGSQLFWVRPKVGDKLTLEIPVPTPGKYELALVATRAKDYGVAAFSVDDKPVAKSVDFYFHDVVNTDPIKLGAFDFGPGRHTLTIEITGSNKQAVKSHLFAIDYITLKAAQ